MKDHLTVKDLKIILNTIAQLMRKNRERLIELDCTIGDGDLGVTMEKGFTAAERELADFEGTAVDQFTLKVGMAIAKAAPSTMGTLTATGFMRAAKACKGREALNAEDLCTFFSAFADGIKERGKAELGDKTVLDVLYPCAEAICRQVRTATGTDHTLDDAVQTTLISPSEALWAGQAAAEKAFEQTKQLTSQHGKAAVFREKSIGLPDPGSAAILLIIQGFAKGSTDI